jgi:hypothetical protein
LPKDHVLGPWLRSYRLLDENAQDDPDGPEHGLGVTSAFLFGPIQPNETAPRPFAYVDHLRVLDKETDAEDPLELYRTLGLVEQVLLSRQYHFINLSLGPDLPVEDTDVHAWTSVIDDRASGNARVQVPSDCVNALAVGAANETENSWARASYSAIGPGRSPGVVKPDLVAFGGSALRYFHVLAPGNKPLLAPQLGTSFASPYLLRNAVGIRAILGPELTPLAIKALLVHSADPPAAGLTGKIRLTATFCYASPTDPQDAAAYTQAGLEIVFRPSDKKIKAGKANADTKGFFDLKKYATEQERRSDLGKWETVLHSTKGMRGNSLANPVFDIHYNAREAGGRATGADKIRYALIITVEAPKHVDLYNEILRAYATTLVPIQPQVSLPIRVR